jgi:hypothetical protein
VEGVKEKWSKKDFNIWFWGLLVKIKRCVERFSYNEKDKKDE